MEVRAHTLGIPRRGEELLVERYTRDGPFYRPIGGGIEFGEHSHEAVVREFREETGHAVVPVGLVGVVENVFEFDGTPGHELSVVHEVAFRDESVYERDTVAVEEGDDPTRCATWHTPAELRDGEAPCYPEGVLDLLGEPMRVTSKR